jgi:hypothetical protein
MAVAPQVALVGLSSLRRDMAKLTGNAGPLVDAMKKAGAIAAEPVAATARGDLPQLTGRLAGDVRVSATKTGASVRMGRASLRYAGWVEFGGTRRVPHTSTRPYDPRGRYLFPAAVSMAARSADLYSAEITKALDGFTWTNETNDPGAVHD